MHSQLAELLGQLLAVVGNHGVEDEPQDQAEPSLTQIGLGNRGAVVEQPNGIELNVNR